MNPNTKGYFTSEFLMSMVSILATAIIGALNLAPSELAKLPAPWGAVMGSIGGVVIPLLVGWISAHYVKGRNDIKLATIAAGKAATEAPVVTLNR